jgi:uncharacterized protein YndB with AHSA1/START domain
LLIRQREKQNVLSAIMTTTPSIAQKEKASTVRTTFSRETQVNIEIKADAAIVWALLIKASDYPRWNSTVISIEGNIAPGEKIKLKSTLDSKRIFQLKVKEFEPEKRLVWGDGQGNRIYTLTKKTNETIRFSMIEKIGGFMFPMYAHYIPPFDTAFEQFAADLKKEAEVIMNSK